MYCTVDFHVRNATGLSNNEYILCMIIYHLANNPDSRTPGWCYASRGKLGEFVGIGERAIRSMLNRCSDLGFIEHHDSRRLLRTTQLFYNTVIMKAEQTSGIRQKGTIEPEVSSSESGRNTRSKAEETPDNSNSNSKPNSNIDNSFTLVQKCDWLIDKINENFGRSFKHGNRKALDRLKVRMSEGFTAGDFLIALKNIKKSSFGRDKGYDFATPEYITRHDKLEYWIQFDASHTDIKPDVRTVARTTT